MIHYLKINNFGPIAREVELNFEATVKSDDSYEILMPDGRRLLKLAYIYGPNASGKTTVFGEFGELDHTITCSFEHRFLYYKNLNTYLQPVS